MRTSTTARSGLVLADGRAEAIGVLDRRDHVVSARPRRAGQGPREGGPGPRRSQPARQLRASPRSPARWAVDRSSSRRARPRGRPCRPGRSPPLDERRPRRRHGRETKRLPFRLSALSVDLGSVRVLRRVGERLARHEVRRGLDPILETLLARLDFGPQRRARRQLAQGGGEAVVKARGTDSARELAQLLDGTGDLADRCVELFGFPARGGELPLDVAQARARSRPAAAGRRRAGLARAAGAPRTPR